MGGGPDDSFSLEFNELKNLCYNVNIAWEAIGKVDYGLKSSEIGNIKFRRSLYFVKNLNKGEIITEDHIRSIRPGYGIEPKFFEEVIGKKAKKSINFGTSVQWDLIK